MFFDDETNKKISWLVFFIILFCGTFFVFRQFDNAFLFKINNILRNRRDNSKKNADQEKKTNFSFSLEILILALSIFFVVILLLFKVRKEFFLSENVERTKIIQKNKLDCAYLLVNLCCLDKHKEIRKIKKNEDVKNFDVRDKITLFIKQHKKSNKKDNNDKNNDEEQALNLFIDEIVDPNNLKDLFLILLSIQDTNVNYLYQTSLNFIQYGVGHRATNADILQNIYKTLLQFLEIISFEVFQLFSNSEELTLINLKETIENNVENNAYSAIWNNIQCISGNALDHTTIFNKMFSNNFNDFNANAGGKNNNEIDNNIDNNEEEDNKEKNNVE